MSISIQNNVQSYMYVDVQYAIEECLHKHISTWIYSNLFKDNQDMIGSIEEDNVQANEIVKKEDKRKQETGIKNGA